jgi:hypothetical protein
MKKTRPVSADQYLESMSQRKTNLNNEFLNAMQKNAAAGGHAIDQAWNRAFSWLTPADYQIMNSKVLSGQAKILKHISSSVMHVDIPHNDNVYEAAYDKINKKIMTIHRAKYTVFNMMSNAKHGRIRTKKPSPDLLIKKAYPNAVDPVTSYPSATNLHETGKTQGSDMPDPNVQQYRDHEDTTRPASYIVAQTADTRRFLKKKAGLDLKHMTKEYLLPSLVAGPLIGAGVTAATSKNKQDFKKNISKGIGVGIGADIATGAAMGLWNQRKNIGAMLRKSAATSVSNLPQTGGSNIIYMSDAPKTQGWVDDARAYRLTDYSEQGNPASVSVKQTPMKTRTVPLTLR